MIFAKNPVEISGVYTTGLNSKNNLMKLSINKLKSFAIALKRPVNNPIDAPNNKSGMITKGNRKANGCIEIPIIKK
jgi:hypothetical protein